MPGMHPKPASRLACLLALALAGLVPASAAADTLVLNKHGDHAPGPCTADDCTLREAAIAATAMDGNDRIELPGTKPYELKRSSGLAAPEEEKGDLDLGMAVALDNDFKLIHPGAGLATIDASEADDRAIEVIGFLKLIKVKVRGGESIAGAAGGGISVPQGALVVRDSRIVENTAANLGGGIYGDDANVIVRKSVIARNQATAHGGGIFADPDGSFELDRTTVTRNTAVMGDGGGAVAQTGLFNGSSRIIASTIARNEAADDGGGLYAEAATLSATNSTITKNSAGARGGGIYAAPESDSALNAVTIARNRADSDDSGSPDFGGGIFADGGDDVVELRNSLLVKNRETDGSISECDAPAPVGIVSLGGNLLTSEADCPFLDDPEDILDDEPGIAKLQDAGGPTQTVPLQSASPAINQADGPNPPATDQRGRARGNPDIGAYER
jgi:hypothetical protein